MYNQFMNNPNLERINRQIDDLNNLKQQMLQPPAPINNYINTGIPKIELEAKILAEHSDNSESKERYMNVSNSLMDLFYKEVENMKL